MHENGIIYRDIKPDNICFVKTNSDRLKIVDFGSAAYLKDGDFLSEPFGGSYYLSPEMIKGHYDKGVDVWALGITCFMLL